MNRDKTYAHFDSGLAHFFRGLGNFMDLISHMVKNEQAPLSAEKEIQPQPVFGVRAVYGFTMRSDGSRGSRLKMETFGNITEGQDGYMMLKHREPLIDLADEGDILVVMAEIPGADVNKTEIQIKGDKLFISALGPQHNYIKRVRLPNTSKGQILGWSFRNGILEISISKKGLNPELTAGPSES